MGLVTEQKKPFASFIVTQDGEFFMQMVKKRQIAELETR
jgi:hypothetical protein